MSHFELHHVVTLTVESDPDTLDALQSELPADDSPAVGPEYDGPQRTTTEEDDSLSDGEERLTARVTFVSGTIDVDGTTYDGATEAADLFDRLAAAVPSGATLTHYRSPTGGVTSSDVQAWYEDHPEEQPTDDNGDAFVPSSWDPSRHVVDQF
ncbi:hypothetical protein C5C07_15355 [Haloferax sp. Atlit-4N]|uniref:hypothetical protein n=1 Tax=Haloferax sp. Atlit-4N TaxID=2077206 RepID=UPI000E239A66|nr:hypothetical protein [Haloferax sp. Atlit-4N]RDZ53110.1 hypothetical protein C5C07_15355 [Haloferax sp. Atlit-4N]